jgi:hypothetical protein
MVRELGFMSTTLAATHYSPSAVHTLLEVSMRGDDRRAAGHVAGTGKIERQPDGLPSAGGGELEERPCAEDARAKSLALTARARYGGEN